MIDLDNIRNFTIARPDPNFIGTGEEFDALPETHRDQMLFLDRLAEKYIYNFVSAAGLITGGLWDPFAAGNFRTVERFDRFYGIQDSKEEVKKWLFNRGIPFQTWVFVLMGANQPPMLMTWKMLLKYVEHILFGDDVVVFDRTQNWCLVYFHENELFFGKEQFFNPAESERAIRELNEKKDKYPKFRHPFRF